MKMEGILDGMGLLRDVRVGNARLVAARTRSIIDQGLRLLGKDIGALLTPASRSYLEHVR